MRPVCASPWWQAQNRGLSLRHQQGAHSRKTNLSTICWRIYVTSILMACVHHALPVLYLQ